MSEVQYVISNVKIHALCPKESIILIVAPPILKTTEAKTTGPEILKHLGYVFWLVSYHTAG